MEWFLGKRYSKCIDSCVTRECLDTLDDAEMNIRQFQPVWTGQISSHHQDHPD